MLLRRKRSVISFVSRLKTARQRHDEYHPSLVQRLHRPLSHVLEMRRAPRLHHSFFLNYTHELLDIPAVYPLPANSELPKAAVHMPSGGESAGARQKWPQIRPEDWTKNTGRAIPR